MQAGMSCGANFTLDRRDASSGDAAMASQILTTGRIAERFVD
jgi:hypothetical protein